MSAVVTAIVCGLLVASPTLAAPAHAPTIGRSPATVVDAATTATIALATEQPTVADAYLLFTVSLTPVPIDTTAYVGKVTIYDAGSWASLGVANYPSGATSVNVQTSAYPYLDFGSHTVFARFEAPGAAVVDSAPLTFAIGPAPTSVLLTGPDAPAQANHSFAVTATLSAAPYGPSGSISFYREGSSDALCVRDIPFPRAPVHCEVPALAAGTYRFFARFSGTTFLLLSQSAPLSVAVAPDILDAGGIGVQYATFYPVADGYRDAVGIRGFRNEPISVSIKIYNASKALVRSAAVPLGSYDYLYLWNGRNSSGSVLAEGTYRVVQTLKDAFGTAKSVTSYVSLSRKHLVYRSATLTKYPKDLNYGVGYLGNPLTTSSYVKLQVSQPGGYVQAGWAFTLPSATVYKSFSFRVYARHRTTSTAPTWVGARYFTPWCPDNTAWGPACFDHRHAVGNSTATTAWFSTGTFSSANRLGRVVRGQVVTYAGTTYVYKAQVVVRYGVLGY